MDWNKVLGYGVLGGVGIVGVYFLLAEWEKKKLIDEFTAKVQRYQEAYLNAINKGDYEGAQNISNTYETMMNEEVAVIEQKGWGVDLIEALVKFGIVISLGIIGTKIVNYMMKRYPPNRPQCPYDGQTFPSTAVLEAHLQSAHHFASSAVNAAEVAYHSLSGFFQRLITVFSGFTEAELSTPWGQIPSWVLVAIALVAALIIALFGGGIIGALIGAVKELAPIAAMAAA